MKDIPVFSTENGVASLFLSEIPYTAIARVKILSSESPDLFMEECIGFCRACGAEVIYASEHNYLERFECSSSIFEMQGQIIDYGDGLLFPVQENTLNAWREIANSKFCGIDHAATITDKDCKEMLREGSGYFVHRNGELVGIGRISDEGISLLAAVKPGEGETVVRALSQIVPSEVIKLTVASSNKRAIHLYEKLGFVRTKELTKWYKIF